MTQTNFKLMNRTQLRTYLLDNPQDQQAFHSYMDMLAQEPPLVNGNADDLQDLQQVTQILEQVTSLKQGNKNP